MPKVANQVARAIAARQPNQNQTGRVLATDGPGKVIVVMFGGAQIPGVRYVASYAPAVDDIVVMTRDVRGLVITGKLGVSALPASDAGTSGLYHVPRIDVTPVFTGTWQHGVWQKTVNNECRFGEIDGVESIGAAYYGRALQGTELYTADDYFLSIVRLPSPGHIPTKVTIALLEGLGPTDAGPVVLDTITGLTLTGPGMGDYAESLSMQFQGWEPRFNNGEAGGLALLKDASEPDHLTRVAGTYGCSMTVTGYPAWGP